MISVDVYAKAEHVQSFRVNGHADYDSSGQDIVCAAVSILVYNAINSCEKLAGVFLDVNDMSDVLTCRVPSGERSNEVQLLLRSMIFGVEQLTEQYPEYVQLKTHPGEM